MRLVIIESPYSGKDDNERNRNVEYARDALLDSLARGEAPLASHLLYTQVLSDEVPDQRNHGVDAGLAWAEHAEATVVYLDLGVSAGMVTGLEHAARHHRPIELRKLAGWSPAT